MRLFGSEVLIENCEVKGIQGAVSIEENAKAEIRSGKAYNHVTNTVYAPAAGYQWQAITDGDNLKWAVVPATR